MNSKSRGAGSPIGMADQRPTLSADGPAAELLVIGAHMFDAEAMAGGLCATVAAQGGRAILVHLSDGEQGHVSLEPQAYAVQKRAEASAAAIALGAEHVAFHLPDTHVSITDEVALRVARLIRVTRPRTIVGHWRGSWHRDHRAAYQALMDGLFLAALPTVLPEAPPHMPAQILYAENWEDADGFEPSAYVDITAGYDSWVTAMDSYELCRSTLASFPYRDYYLSLARLRGCLHGVHYAEAFMPVPRAVAAGLGIFHSADDSVLPGRPRSSADHGVPSTGSRRDVPGT